MLGVRLVCAQPASLFWLLTPQSRNDPFKPATLGVTLQRTNDRRWHTSLSYFAAGLACALLPVFNGFGVVPGFICLSFVIVFSLCPNGCLLALASAKAQGPAMPISLALFNSVGNVAGFFGSMLLGVVVDATCSYDGAFILMGIVLMIGGLLVLAVQEVGGKGEGVEMSLGAQHVDWLHENAAVDVPDDM
jgi:predicted MFS family arabinose efflux permease